MKNVLKLCLLLFLPILVGSGCDKDSDDSFELTQERLIGTWLEIDPCDSCRVFSFTAEGKILQISTVSSDTSNYSFNLLSENKIEVTREWLVGQEGAVTEHYLNFITDDNLRIPDFYIAIAGVDRFKDVSLIRMN